MAPLTRDDMQAVRDEARREAERAAEAKPVTIGDGSRITIKLFAAGIAAVLSIGGIGAWAQAAAKDADTAQTTASVAQAKAADLDKRVSVLEEQRKADREATQRLTEATQKLTEAVIRLEAKAK